VTIEKQFKVSAIVPLFNGEQFISESIGSLLSQTCPVDEIIVIDDKSTDRGLEKVQKLAEANQTIKLLRNSSNKGSSYCRNLGIKDSSGDYVLFLDQDDYLCANFNDEVRNHLHKQPSKDIAGLHTSYFIVDKNGDNPIKTSCQEIEPNEFLGHQFVRNRILSNSGTVVRKKIFDKAGFYDESLKFSQDWDLWFRIGKIGVFTYLNKPLTYIRRHSNNTSAKIDGFLEDEKKILKKYDLGFIKELIFKRNSSIYTNQVDYISILLRLDHWKSLTNELEQLDKEYRDHFDHYFYFGLLHYNEENISEAIKCFQKIPFSSSFFYSAQNNLAASFILIKDLKSAKKILNEILLKKPNFQDAEHNLRQTNPDGSKALNLKITTRPLRSSLYQYS
jgi:glycosyltransferase involved in cell wall biosynthesis